MFERYIDDFLSASGIAHEVEPDYPYDDELNVTGLRADWRLGDGTLVEAAGMMNDAAYEERIQRKKQLAERAGIELLVVLPEHLTDLRAVFHRQLR